MSLSKFLTTQIIFLALCVHISYCSSANPSKRRSGIEPIPSRQVDGNPAAIHNCTAEQLADTLVCLKAYFEEYALLVNGKLPNRKDDPFKVIRGDTNNMCQNYKTLSECKQNAFKACSNFVGYLLMLENSLDADYYVSEIGLQEFYCNHGKDFIEYSECLSNIDDNDLIETVFVECSVSEVATCQSVVHTLTCERAVFRRVCGERGVRSYCAYQKILLEMNGWANCEDMPCTTGSEKLSIFLVFCVIFSNLLLFI